ncbi:uncharacterized protein BJX67DRAFT_197499 [Aspergillus lucknowensis]|uniref:Uncharacterized protein n=1 Tax=Aspergillus lucknowensis TaxID=176173 RepID=A0ABR4LK81_9EURO
MGRNHRQGKARQGSQSTDAREPAYWDLPAFQPSRERAHIFRTPGGPGQFQIPETATYACICMSQGEPETSTWEQVRLQSFYPCTYWTLCMRCGSIGRATKATLSTTLPVYAGKSRKYIRQDFQAQDQGIYSSNHQSLRDVIYILAPSRQHSNIISINHKIINTTQRTYPATRHSNLGMPTIYSPIRSVGR